MFPLLKYFFLITTEASVFLPEAGLCDTAAKRHIKKGSSMPRSSYNEVCAM